MSTSVKLFSGVSSNPSLNVSRTYKQWGFINSRISCLVSSNGNVPFMSEVRRRRGELAVTNAKDKNNTNKKKKDSHSYVSKPDESTGPFPEAVLLKEKKLKEDGRLLPEFEDAEEEKLFDFLSLQIESDLNLEQMRHYEVIYLIHEDRLEEVADINSKVQDFIKEKKGRIYRVSDWGLRRLAYKIQKASNAHYMLMNFEFEAKWINDFMTLLDKDERVIRHLVIKRDEAITEDCPSPLEFHTLRADMDSEDDEEDMDSDDEEEDWDDDEDIILVDDEEDGEDSNVESVSTGEKKVYA